MTGAQQAAAEGVAMIAASMLDSHERTLTITTALMRAGDAQGMTDLAQLARRIDEWRAAQRRALAA